MTSEVIDKPVTILFTIPNFISAGSGRVMMNIIQRLDRELFAPAVCVSRKGGNIDREVEQMGIPFIEAPFTVPVKPYATLPARARDAARVFKPHHFTIWHSWHYADDYSEPVIAHYAGVKNWVFTKKSMSWGSNAWLMRSLLARRIAIDNTEMADLFFNRFGLKKKTRYIPHGIPTDLFSPAASPSLNLRARLNLPADAVMAACVAQLVPVKDHPSLLRAVAQLPGVQLLLAGSTTDQDYQTQLEALCCELNMTGRVHFLGSVSNIPALLAESDVFVLPSRMEGCPVALLEAMSCGKACVATDIPGSRDLIVHGESGILVPASNPQALAIAIQQLLADAGLRARLGENARKRVEEGFSIEREVRLHEAMYAELAGWRD